MKLLVVEGNIKETRIEREKYGIVPFHLLFPEMLKMLDPTIQTQAVFPADDDKHLPTIKQLQKYDGVLWTGSALSVLDDIPSVNRQLNFADNVFKSGVPFYGSCWGMQVATVVAGGEVANSPNGLEVGISKSIKLTKEGAKNPFFKGRKDNFKALCIHFDEVVKIPKNAVVLAGNDHSKVQAMTFAYKNSQFFGVQYHPEFKTSDMSMIISFLSDKLIKMKAFSSKYEVDDLSKKILEQIQIPKEISDYLLHTKEIKSWLYHISKK